MRMTGEAAGVIRRHFRADHAERAASGVCPRWRRRLSLGDLSRLHPSLVCLVCLAYLVYLLVRCLASISSLVLIPYCVSLRCTSCYQTWLKILPRFRAGVPMIVREFWEGRQYWAVVACNAYLALLKGGTQVWCLCQAGTEFWCCVRCLLDSVDACCFTQTEIH